MVMKNHHGWSHPAGKMLPVGEARRCCRYEIEDVPLSRHGRLVRTTQRLTGAIREMKRRHTKKSRAYGRSLCREADRG